MRTELEKRVTELEAEYRAGQEMLTELEAKRTDLHQTLLRISGAIQVLKELLGEPGLVNGSAEPVNGSTELAGDGVEPPSPSLVTS